MNEKFKYRSVWADVLMYLAIAGVFLPLLLKGSNASIKVMLLIILGYPVISVTIAALLQKVPAKLKAEKSSVEFIFLLHRVSISYSDIKSIEVKNEYVEGSFRGEKPRYEEVITIICKDREYCFDNIMDFDVGRFETNPEDLAMQFRCGVFRRLKEYISKQTGITY